jgi:uncharacterized protein YdhG (YjbR/CyaY superfamily)
MSDLSPVEIYISRFPQEVQSRLNTIRTLIKKTVPDSGEKISYGVPTATLNGKYFIYFAGYKNHLSIYPVTAAMEKELPEAMVYRTGKGTLQFPLDQPLPKELIQKIITVRYKEIKTT